MMNEFISFIQSTVVFVSIWWPLLFPRSLCLSCSYGHVPGFAAPARGKWRWTGA